MRFAALVLAPLLILVGVPPVAQANPCHIDDPVCVANCLLDDPCGLYRFEPELIPCGPGETGVAIDTGSRTTDACVHVPDVTLGSCPQGQFGVIVYVDGQPREACLL